MHAAKACLLAVGLTFVLGCNSRSFPGSNSGISNIPAPSIVSFSPGSTPQGSPNIYAHIEGTNFPPTDSAFQPAVLWSINRGQSAAFLEITHRNNTTSRQ